MASFEENLTALATQYCYALPLDQNQLRIVAFSFQGGSLIPGDATNKAFRLFLEDCAQNADSSQMLDCATIRGYAQKFFAEIWEDEPGTGKHANLDWLGKSQKITLYSRKDLQEEIDRLWEIKDTLTPEDIDSQLVVEIVLKCIDAGSLRVATRTVIGEWITHEWLKKAVLLSFRLNRNEIMNVSPGSGLPPTMPLGPYWDKVPNKFAGWNADKFQRAGFRAVPGAVVRRGAYIAKNVVLMPSFVNIGAYVDEGTMIDGWATVGSCAQIGKSCHISGGVGIGGVLEPLQANPVIIEDHVFIGARSEIAEGVIVCQGAVLAMGVYLSQSTKIYNRATGEITYGMIPPYAVVVPGALPDPNGGPSLYCVVIVKTVDQQTRAKTEINALLRD